MRRLAKLATWLLLIVVCGLIGYRRYAQHESASIFNAFLAQRRNAIDRDVEQYIMARSQVLAIPQLQLKSRSKDAGARLNAWVAWPGSASGLSSFTKKPDALERFVKKLRVWDKAWPEHAAEASLAEFDFSWMKELRAFDHWHLDGAPTVKQALQSRVTILPISIPAPDPASLDGWSELRLLHGLQQRNLNEALIDTSHLATLLFSSEDSAMTALGFRILQRQRQAAEQYRKAVDARFDYAKAQVVSEAALASAFWLVQKAPLFFNLFTDRDTLIDIYADGKPDPIGCASANTTGPLHLRNLRVVGDLFADNQKAIGRVLHDEWKGCALTRLRLYWDTASTTTSDLAAEPFVPPPLPELAGFDMLYPVFETIAQVTRRDRGTLPAIMEYSSALRRAMAISWARQSE